MFLPSNVKRVITKDVDQIMQYGTLQYLFDTDLVYSVRDHDDKDKFYSKKAVFAFAPYCIKANPKYEKYRFWMSDNWKRYYGDRPYHFAGLGVIDLSLYTELNTQAGLILAYNALKWKTGALDQLDQDLINIYQTSNKVVSLDENMLWCDTWCHESLMEDSMFIDFCKTPV